MTNLLLIIALTLTPGVPDEEAALLVQLKGANLVVAGTAVKLSDVADVTVLAPDDRLQKVLSYRANSAVVARFAPGAMHVDVTLALLKKQLEGLGFSRVEIEGPARLRVNRRGRRIDNRRLLDLTRDHVASVLAGVDDDASVEFAKLVDPVTVPVGRYMMDLRIAADPKNPDYIGEANLRLVAEIDGAVEELARVPVRISRRVAAIRMARDLRRGQIVSRADLEFEERIVSRLGGELFYRIDDAVGLVATRDLRRGDDLMRFDLKQLPVVRKEDLVHVRSVNGRIKVEILCMALEDGAPGERIRLQNLSSKRTIEAVVVDHQTAEIDLGRR